MTYMSQEGYDKMIAELTRLESVERPKASAAIAEARDKGDLSENSEYDAAKEAQAHLEDKINRLKLAISEAKIVDVSRLSSEAVQILSKVEMTNLTTKSKMTYTIVSENEADLRAGIAAGEIPCYKCAENEKFYAFLDINPLVKGHTLVIPRREVDYIFDLDDDELAEMTVFAKRVAVAIKKAFPCVKVGMAVLGLEVPHAHIHLVPMQSEKDMLFSNPKLQLSQEEFENIAARIREEFK